MELPFADARAPEPISTALAPVVLFEPEVINLPASYPNPTLSEPEFMFKRDKPPTAVFRVPEVLNKSDDEPTAVLSEAVLLLKALLPNAEFPVPVVFEFSV